MKIVYICSGIIIDELKRIFLIKRKYNAKFFPNHWATPWWYVDDWESFEECAIREVKEETWLDFKITKLFIEDELVFEKEWRINKFHRYLWNYSWNIKIQEDEIDWWAWFTYKETKNLLIYQNMKHIIEELYKQNLII
jgi:ADP-ribose pyrophosphatase YjhB (NUDIX family)